MDRLDELRRWLASVLPAADFALEPASADASFRRYFRATIDGQTWIAMDAPPEHEDCRPFVHVAGLLLDAGLHAPRVLAQDLDRGFLLLTDLGRVTFLAELQRAPERAAELYRAAIEALVTFQRSSREHELPPYDEALLRRELALFPEWYLGRHLGWTLGTEEHEALETLNRTLLANILAQPRVYVHRDYMPRNLMVSDPNPGVLDFQDAVYGPITYDIASLMRDAFLSWDEERQLEWIIQYWERARAAGLPVDGDFGAFYQNVEWMGLQRHLKVLGIFARLSHRDGKRGYVEDTPRFLAYAGGVARRYRELAPLVPLLDRIEARTVDTGLTF